MVGQVAHILVVFEGDGKGQSIKGCSPFALGWTKVVSEGENTGSYKVTYTLYYM